MTFTFKKLNYTYHLHDRAGHGQIEPISSSTGQEAVMLTTSHEFLI